MNYSVYKHTFPDNKVYIGITCQNPEDRWDKGRGYIGQPRMARAIIEYGWDNIDHKILFDGLTEDEAKEIEAKLIAEYNSNNIKYGYNVSASGLGNKNKEDNNRYDYDYVYRPENGLFSKNQRVIKINKASFNKDDIYTAMKLFSGETFKLYIYFCNNEDQYVLPISQPHICGITGMSRSSFKRGIEQLKEANYIVLKQGKSYDFYTSPVVA